jgi:hypothetical protein
MIYLQRKNIIRIVMPSALILLIPFTAMEFTNEVNWTVGDFIVASILLFAAGLSYDLLSSKAKKAYTRSSIAVAVLCCLLLAWTELAVGIF